MPCVREYPTGVDGRGDVDSGPLIFERSLSGTVFMIGLAQIHGDHEIADAIATTGEAVGLPWTSGDEKRYVAGILPIGDIMVAYSQNARCWLGESQHQSDPQPISKFWRLPVHLLSLFFLVPTLVGLLRKRHSAS